MARWHLYKNINIFFLSDIPNDIIEGCRQRNKQQQEQLYRLAYLAMMKVCLRYAADEQDAGAIYNTAMLKVFTSMEQYKAKGPVMAWIRRIMVNCCIDHCRQQLKFVTAGNLYDVAAETIHISPEAYDRFSAAETMKLLIELPGNTAIVFNLFAIEGYKHAEIAKVLHITTGTSKWHLNEARRLLKMKLDTFLKKEIYSDAI
jgi:RNA polymerase sigma-70 factor (ECF subfamily)